MQTKQLSGSGNYRDFAATGAWWVTGLKITEEDVPAFVLQMGIFSLWRCRAYRPPFSLKLLFLGRILGKCPAGPGLSNSSFVAP